MSLADDLKARFKEFAGVDDQDINELEAIWPCYYGGGYADCNREIALNLVAHLLVTDGDGGGNAAPSRVEDSRSVGSVSVSFASAASDPDMAAFFGTTKYGQRFLFLTRTRAAGKAFFV